jgi:periplasmic divalent cation tolerance protein
MGLNKKKSYRVILTTAKSKKEARTLAQGLVKRRMAACVNIVGPAESHYVWEGKLCVENEYMMFIKTESKKFLSIKEYIRKNHSYQVPEMIELAVTRGDESYLNWISKAVNG